MRDEPGMNAGHRCRLPNGLTVESLNSRDTLMVYRDIFEDDCYRRSGVTIHDGDCILDVGANTGLFVLYLNKILSNARVYAFEPVPETFRVLRRNVERHNRLTIQLFNVGLSHRPGQVSFTHYPRMSNASTMYPDDSERAVSLGREYILERFRMLPDPWSFILSLCPASIRNALAEQVRRYYLKRQAVTCELRTLSDFLGEHRIARVDLLKVDAEQSEQHILAGLADKDWPKIRQMVVEVHEGDEATGAMVESLRRRGFDVAAEPNPTFPSLSLVSAVRPDDARRN